MLDFAKYRSNTINRTLGAAMPRTINDNIAIFDIDGCIADDLWRRERIPENASQSLEYDFYHAGCGGDPELAVGSARLRNHINNGDFIVFATARPFKVAELTINWIGARFGIEPQKEFMVLMRKDGDSRSAVEVKREMTSYIQTYAKESGRNVTAAYDDRVDIIEMYLEAGWNASILDADGERFIPSKQAAINEEAVPLGASVDGYPTTTEAIRAQGLAALAAQDKQPEQPERLTPLAEILAPRNAADVLTDAAAIFRERNANYKDNAVLVGNVMKALFPNGVVIHSAADHHLYHLFELMIVKLTRFVKSDLKHKDSIHDLAVYAAMLEPLLDKHGIVVAQPGHNITF
jgi:hypothetical protein